MFCHKDKPVCKVVRCKLCRLRWLVPVFIFLMVCNFERIQQQDWRRPVEHFYRVDLYNHWLSKNRCHFVTISFHGNAFIGLLRSTKKKLGNSTEGHLRYVKIAFFLNFLKFRSLEFFLKSLCIFLFKCQKQSLRKITGSPS